MTRQGELILCLGVPPALVVALTRQGLNARATTQEDLLSGASGAAVLLVQGDARGDPLHVLAKVWGAEPDLPVVLLDDGDPELRRAALRAGVVDTLSPPHTVSEVHRAVALTAEKRAAGALQVQRDLARRMSTISALSGAATGRDFLQPVLDELAALFDVKRASIFLFDDPGADDPHLELAAHIGLSAAAGVQIKKGVGIAGRVAADGIPQLLLGAVEGYARFRGVASDRTVTASLCVPIRAAGDRGYGQVVGVLNLARTQGGEIFTPRDLEVCEFIAALIGQALSRVELDQGRADLQQKMAATERLAYAGELAAGIAHEVASPIGYLRANLKVLSDYWDDLAPYLADLRAQGSDPLLDEIRDDLPTLLEECLVGVDRAARIVQDMKAMVRLDASEQPKEPVDVGGVVRSALHLLRPRLADRCLVDVRTPSSPLFVDGHELELSQVLVNLIVNALDACLARVEVEPEHQPRIGVTVAAHGSNCVVTVCDNGTGIAPRDQARIFAPLFTTKPSGVGTGLGLGIVKRIVTAHDGSIELASSVGQGTTFGISLPLLTRRAQGPGPVDVETTSAGPRP